MTRDDDEVGLVASTAFNAVTRRQKASEEETHQLRELFSSRWLTVEELQEIERESGKRFKRGKFSEKEKQTIRDTLKEFLADRGLSESDFIEVFFNRKTESHQHYDDPRFNSLFKAISMRLDGRPILMAYQCVRRMYHPGNGKGKWSTQDDGELRRLFEIHGPDWETIGKHLDRYGMSCRDRFRLLRGKVNTGPWSENEVRRLREAVAGVKSISDGSPCWPLVSERVETRSVAQCQIKWISLDCKQKNNGRRIRWTPVLDYYLISRIYETAVDHESEIIWRDLLDDGWPIWIHQSILYSRWRLLKRRIRNERNLPIDGNLIYLSTYLTAVLLYCFFMIDVLEALMLNIRRENPDIENAAHNRRELLTPEFVNDSDLD